jgi:hypothetical protein
LSSHKIKLSATNGKADRGESAIDDEMDEDMDDEDVNSFDQLRTRRASEGSHLIKDGKKSGGGDLKCDKCGKGYKHSSCLTKHLHVSPYHGCIKRIFINIWLQMGAHT